MIGIIPIGIDGFWQLFTTFPYNAVFHFLSFLPYHESSPLGRTLTGALFGLANVWLAYPYFEASMREARAGALAEGHAEDRTRRIGRGEQITAAVEIEIVAALAGEVLDEPRRLVGPDARLRVAQRAPDADRARALVVRVGADRHLHVERAALDPPGVEHRDDVDARDAPRPPRLAPHLLDEAAHAGARPEQLHRHEAVEPRAPGQVDLPVRARAWPGEA